MRVINETKLEQVLDFIKNFQMKEGRSPSYRQIMKAVGFSSLSNAQRYVKVLQSRGLIRRNDLGKIITPSRLLSGKTINAPLVGTIACGSPILAEQNIEANIKLPVEIFGNKDVIMLHAQGDSMIGVGIFDGDLIVARPCSVADDGDIVVALIDDSATVKTFYRKNGHTILHPENPAYKDILADNVIIQGIVKHNIHSF